MPSSSREKTAERAAKRVSAWYRWAGFGFLCLFAFFLRRISGVFFSFRFMPESVMPFSAFSWGSFDLVTRPYRRRLQAMLFAFLG